MKFSPIFLTGVSRGLGRALAELLIENGHTVIGCARSEAAIDELRDAFPAPNRFSVVNVADADEVADWIESNYPSEDCSPLLINNAALINANANLWEVPPEEFARLTAVNINGTYHCIRSIVPKMMESGGGGIINFSSTWGRSTSPEVAPYCATKFAIEGLTSALASELPSSIFTVAMNPGVINTDMLQSCFGGGASGYPSAREWADVAMPFFLSLSRSNNGESLRVPI
ncbi:MAG: SDR family oxidoreductase [Planctomycetota bacterium]